jgi:hypothetical protein
MSHNLNIQTYSFEELLDLFSLSKNFDINELKQAKRKVLYMHPDKSRLPTEYFLFYKKAFEIIVTFFEDRMKQDRPVPQTKVEYTPMNTSENKKVGKVINGMKSEDFNAKFNEIFDKNMAKGPPDPSRNAWFQQETALYDVPEKVSQQNMGSALKDIRERGSEMIRYRGVETMYSVGAGGANLYDDGEAEDTGYIASDMFGKLKYDDLRRVHKDQTVFSVSESDYDKMSKYASVDHLSQERSKQNLTPLEKSEAEAQMRQQEQIHKEALMKRQYEAKLRTLEYEEKNKRVLANFLRLT